MNGQHNKKEGILFRHLLWLPCRLPWLSKVLDVHL